MREPNFSDVLEMARRSAKVDLKDGAWSDSARRTRGSFAHLHQLAGRLLELVGRAAPVPAASYNPYSEHQGDEPLEPPARLPSDPKSVAAELRITAHMSTSDLSRLRREFARTNHPDRVGAALQEDATRRMMVANMLIDRELKKRASR